MQKQILRSGEGQSYNWSSDHITVKSALDYSQGRVTLVEDTLKPGFHLPRHYHKVMTEIFYILEGEVTFVFDDETVIATKGTTLNVPPFTWHEVKCADGAKLLTIFSPGGFDSYLAELAGLTDADFQDAQRMTALSQKYDSWEV